jgi:hypothetical protein
MLYKNPVYTYAVLSIESAKEHRPHIAFASIKFSLTVGKLSVQCSAAPRGEE